MRRGFQPPADLWGSVGDFGGGDFGSPNVRSTFWENLGFGRSTLNLIKLDIWKTSERSLNARYQSQKIKRLLPNSC